MSTEGLKKEFLVERQGKQFVLYAGLLDFSHQKGLKSLRTEIQQIPTKDNGEVAVCTAVAVFDDGKQFTGIGDASPQNVAPAMKTCLLRMAETRSKARALRDAVNIGVAALEELQEEETAQEQPRQQAQPAAVVDTNRAAIDAARRTFFARCTELGHTFANNEQGKQEYRSFVSVLLKRSVASLSELTFEDWGVVLRNLNDAQKGTKAA